ncbi:ribonuclease H-like domain-containing protein, partial [Tanacetum coccineum]
MAFSDSEIHNDKPCTKGLDTVEAQLVTYRKNDVLFSEEVVVLKREVGCKQYEINMLKTEFEKVKQEKDGIDFKIEKFEKDSKDLDQLLGSQITNKCKKGLGYHVVPPPYPLIYNAPTKLDLSYYGLEEFQQPDFEGYGSRANKRDDVESPIVVEKKTVVPTIPKVDVVRPKQQEKPIRKTVRYAEMYRSKGPRGNQRNWNNLKSQQLGNEFVMNNKACFACGSFNHLIKDCKRK